MRVSFIHRLNITKPLLYTKIVICNKCKLIFLNYSNDVFYYEKKKVHDRHCLFAWESCDQACVQREAQVFTTKMTSPWGIDDVQSAGEKFTEENERVVRSTFVARS